MKPSKLAIATATATTPSSSMANAFVAQPVNLAANDIMQETEETVSDTWIASKVKSNLVANKNVSGVDIKVETSRGVVSLSGNVKSDTKHDLAIETARGIKGVEAAPADDLKSAGRASGPNDSFSLVIRRKTDEFRCD